MGSLAIKIQTVSLTLACMAHAPCIRIAKAQPPEIPISAKGLSVFQMSNAKASMAIAHASVEFAQLTPHAHRIKQPKIINVMVLSALPEMNASIKLAEKVFAEVSI
jgi:hypothetical protein